LSILSIQTPRVFVPLLKPSRNKGAHGGRGSGKSHFFAEALVEKCLTETAVRAVCIREIQKSLEQSVKRLIEDKILKLGVGRYFEVLDKAIRTPGGGLILFQGMQNHTAESIKSLEGYDLAWVEEAQALSKRSLQLLRPTIRKPGSELWFAWNPASADDPVDRLLRGPDKLTNAIVVESNWRDNPFFPDVLREEMASDLARDADDFDHVWDGGYLTVSDAIIFRRRVSIENFETPKDARFFFGADWGFANDPTTLIRSFIQDDCLFIDREAFGWHFEIDDTAALFDRIPGARQWPIKADNARPETISYLRRQGFNIGPADKWPGSLEDGIAHLKAFKRIVIHATQCPHMQIEARRYRFKVDRKTGEVLPIIVDADNHGWDAARYSLDGYIQRRGANSVWAKLAE
jgi:phage terminase large subunit